MFNKLRDLFKRWKKARRLERLISPGVFVKMSAELKELAGTASKLRQGDPAFQARVNRIRTEMDQLTELAGKPEFRRLTTAKRLELRKSLLMSKAQLLQSMHSAEPPTDTLQ